jgi:alpha-glucosidase
VRLGSLPDDRQPEQPGEHDPAGDQRCVGHRRVRNALAAAIIVLAITAAAPAAAEAQPHVGPGTIVVRSPGGASVRVTRSPFGLSFLDAAGRTVLREVPTTPLPFPVPPYTQNEFGAIGPPAPALYAPLAFLVGSQAVTQSPGGQWEGTLMSVSDAGIEYSAQSVLSARPQGEGVRLTVATNDPTGRRLYVTISPAGPPDAIAVSVRPSATAGVATMGDSFTSAAGEAFHGFGGRHDYLDQHGQEFFNWLQQENVGSGSAQGLTEPTLGDRYLFPNGPSAAYYVQSSFVSTHGYGFLLERAEISHWRLDSDRPDAWQTEVGAPGLDYVVVAAGPDRAIGQLTQITGRQPVPPTWAAGSQFDRLVRFPSDPPATYEREVQSDIENFRRYHLHVDGYRIEGWTELPTPVLRRFISELRALGIHTLLYFRAYVSQSDTNGDFNYAISHGYVATHADGTPYLFISNRGSPAAQIDFTNPAAVAWWQGEIRAALDLGADGFMQDFGEQVLYDMHFHDGETGATMHNRLPVLYDRATRQEVDAFERAHPHRQIFFYTRAGYTGTPGDAAYEGANFPGDETTDWSRSSGLASLTTDMLNRAIGGAFGYSTDIGGYFDLGPYHPTTKQLFLRWAEWAALSPLFRLHGSVAAGTHAPWTYDEQTVRIYEQLTALHLAARPLILRLWREADRTGIPITRPLWLAYPDDPVAARQDQEWLLGPDVLVAPVVTQGASSRRVYFPRGCWRSPVTGRRHRGPGYATVPAPLARLPYFFACGTRPFAAGAGRPPPRRPGIPPGPAFTG